MIPWSSSDTLLTALGIAAHVLLIVSFLVLERRRPTATLAWVLLLVFAPLLGVLAYWLFGATRLYRVKRRSAKVAGSLQKVVQRHDVLGRLLRRHVPARQSGRTAALMRLGRKLASTPATSGNRVAMLVDGAATYRDIIMAINDALDHVHVEFYIFQSDEIGTTIRDRLARRAREGVTVRVLYDAVGSFSVGRSFWKPLVDAGGLVAAYRPTYFVLSLRQRDRIDFRNHRKIVIVDGQTGYTGGINIGREYLGLNPSIGHWRDTHVRIEGPAVLSLQHTFAEDWLVATGEAIDEARYFPDPIVSDEGCVVQIVDSGPDQRWTSIERLYVEAIALAQERVWITSPYFIPDQVMEEALLNAALRDVDVRLLLPKKSDHLLVGLASRSYYEDLLEAGVKIYEYGRGFLHAKTMLVDDWVATIGSANMDMRSFDLNFELNAFAFSSGLADELARQFLHDLADAAARNYQVEASLSYWRRFGRSAARLLSPLL